MTELLLHLAEAPLWEAVRGKGTYEMSTRGRTLQEEGFIHLSLPSQLPGVARMLYGDGGPDLVVLVVDPARLTDPIRYEAMKPGGEEFPHLYGPLPVEAVVEVRPWYGAQGESAAQEESAAHGESAARREEDEPQ
ncbi:Uncharacterized conserved protein, DUF952 family [Streptomyces sp. ScaeMP-e48]|uniref:DUF952 domain-containing protein n=1 Tax=Streptomyces sp. ScaeMP-e48 TaxID=1100823 RepID=UPI000823CD9E|nr:DUF952 domain-containing protein [Streptomyces sp. ScaeMP-e48]SCK08304.1 Uncharacterized conserved protein, DUF952 family [Streptomyces sp. ScaeMP-e48]